jgi:hypothetical protein
MEVCERKIKWHPRTLKICQIPKQGLEYAFLSKDYVQLHQFVWCKDFMQDVIYGAINNQRMEIYGFAYDPTKDPPVDFSKTHMLLNSYKDANFGTKVLNGLRDFLNQVEQQLEMSATVFEKAVNPHYHYRQSGIYIAVGDPRWMHSPPMISLYTMLLRVGLMHKKGLPFMETIQKMKSGELEPYYGKQKGDNDQRLLRNTEKGFERIIQKGDQSIFYEKIEDNYPEKIKGRYSVGVHSIHDSWGMTGFSSDRTKSDFPEWHKDN